MTYPTWYGGSRDDATQAELNAAIAGVDATSAPGHRLLIFYSPPQVINETYDNEAAAAIFAQYDQIVFGVGSEEPADVYYTSTLAIVARVKQLNPRVQIYGYVDMGETAPSTASMQAAVGKWITVGVTGIFFDTVEYAYGVHRSTMNTMVNYCHGLGLGTAINGYAPDDVMGSAVNATYNPAGTPTAMDGRDYYMLEDWAVHDDLWSATHDIEPMSTLKARLDKCLTYRANLGVKLMAISVADYPAHTQAELDFLWRMQEAACLAFGIDSYGLSPVNYSSSGPTTGVVINWDYWDGLDDKFNPSARYAINVAGTEATRADLGVMFHDDSVGTTWTYRLPGPPTSYLAPAAPITGSFNRGDIVWNSAPSAAGVPGWVCTTGGSPGTWKAMAALAA